MAQRRASAHSTPPAPRSVLAGAHRAALAAEQLRARRPAHGAVTLISIFIDSRITSTSPAATRAPSLDLAASTGCRRRALSIARPSGGRSSSASGLASGDHRVAGVDVLAGRRPALALGVERRLLARLEGRDRVAFVAQELRCSRARLNVLLLDLEPITAERKVGANPQQLVLAHRDRSGSGRRSAAATACVELRASRASGSTSAACGRRTDSRPALPCRTRTGRRRRCRPRSPASRCAPGCTWW